MSPVRRDRQAAPGPPGPSPSDHGCPGSSPGIVPININYNNPDIVVAPDPQSVDEGDVIRFNLIGANDVLVSTAGSTPEGGWLNGSGKKKPGNSASNKFYVCVPTDLFPEGTKPDEEKDFKYDVSAVGHPTLDPVVRVRKL